MSAEILQQIPNVPLHMFMNDKKTQLTIGKCKFAKILKDKSRIVYFFNINQFYYTLTPNIVFVKIEYPQTVSFLFPHWDNNLRAISFPINTSSAHNAQQILNNVAILTTYEKAMNDPAIRSLIEVHCPNVKNQQINPDQIQKAVQRSERCINEAFAALGNCFSRRPQNRTNQRPQKKQIQKKVQQPHNPEAVWEQLKNGTGESMKIDSSYAQQVLGKQFQQKKSEKMIFKAQNKEQIVEDQKDPKKAAHKTLNGFVESSGVALNELSTQTKKLFSHFKEKNNQQQQKQIKQEKNFTKQNR